jgi:hypothetical protein
VSTRNSHLSTCTVAYCITKAVGSTLRTIFFVFFEPSLSPAHTQHTDKTTQRTNNRESREEQPRGEREFKRERESGRETENHSSNAMGSGASKSSSEGEPSGTAKMSMDSGIAASLRWKNQQRHAGPHPPQQPAEHYVENHEADDDEEEVAHEPRRGGGGGRRRRARHAPDARGASPSSTTHSSASDHEDSLASAEAVVYEPGKFMHNYLSWITQTMEMAKLDAMLRHQEEHGDLEEMDFASDENLDDEDAAALHLLQQFHMQRRAKRTPVPEWLDPEVFAGQPSEARNLVRAFTSRSPAIAESEMLAFAADTEFDQLNGLLIV